MRILLITINYPPEIGGAPHLIYQLAIRLKARGHEITVLTGYPRYNINVVPPKYRHGQIMKDIMDGVPVIRIRMPSLPRTKKFARGVEHFVYGLWLSLLTTFVPRSDVAMVFSPPLPLPWMVCLIGKIRRIPIVVNIQDLFPLEAVELGMLKNPLLIRLFEAMECQVHLLAAGITVHSPGNLEHVIQHGGDLERVHVVYNWVDTEHIRPGDRDNSFSIQYGLKNSFVVSYAGTMGWAQDMDTIIDCAEILRNDQEIMFLLVGDGVQKNNTQVRCQELDLKNILWLPMQPWSVYPEVLAASDISMINLHPELRTPVVPSKLLSIMAAGRPVVASLPPDSDARHIMDLANCGLYVDAGNGMALAEAIKKLASNRVLAKEMGKRGREYVEMHFTREICIDKAEKILIDTLGGNQQ